MPVFTIFCHGTASHRHDDIKKKNGVEIVSDHKQEMIGEFGRSVEGVEYRDFLILDGPGGSGTSANPMAGKFNPFTRGKESKQLFGNREMGNTGFTSQIGGLAAGQGWNDNVIHAIATLAELPVLPETVNVLGWSRGGVTCAKLAYALNQVFPQIEVNAFAVDPVAGPTARGDVDASTLGPNVKKYVATLAMNEKRGFFQPQSIQRMNIDPGTNALFLPFPGNHSTQVYRKQDANVVRVIVWDIAYRFLAHNGTVFRGDSNVSPGHCAKEYCEFYAKILLNMSDYRAKAQSRLNPLAQAQGGVKARNFTKKLEQYTVESHYFINEHHRKAFDRAFPRAYEYLFEGDMLRGEREVREDFKRILAFPSLMDSLGIFGLRRPNPGQPIDLSGLRGAGHKSSGNQLAFRTDLRNLG
ncbi:MAG: DUF5621 domain-containing protein, partial [Pseudomonadota bacterium]